MNGYKIILKSIVIMLLIAAVIVPLFSFGYCALETSTVVEYSEEENREIMCEQCWDSAFFVSALFDCNEDILEEQGQYNDYQR